MTRAPNRTEAERLAGIAHPDWRAELPRGARHPRLRSVLTAPRLDARP